METLPPAPILGNARGCDAGRPLRRPDGERPWLGLSLVRASVTVVAALDPSHRSNAVLDDLFARYAARIAASPQRNQHYPSIVVVRKTEPL